MEDTLACCGFDCARCEVCIATLSDDDALRREVARKWQAMNQTEEITPETILCTGCRTAGAKLPFCSLCKIRRCVLRHGFATCRDCPQKISCPTIAAVWQSDAEAKKRIL